VACDWDVGRNMLRRDGRSPWLRVIHRIGNTMYTLYLLAFFALGTLTASAQEASPFHPLDLPAANTYRTGSGRPGVDYWQQRVDYTIQASLNVETNEITGSETIRYTNNSPDDLPYLWMHLEQNMCAPTSVTNQLDQPPFIFLGSVFDFSCQGFEGGIFINRIQSAGRDLAHHIYNTTMRVDLAEPLPPGGVLAFDVDWRMIIPPYGGARMGRDEALYEIAQWYPRLAVYDDVRGWNNEPYIGAGEFYLEYGDFDVTLDLPATYLAVATGELQNPEAVLTPTQRERLARAIASETPVSIVTKDEAGNTARTRPSSSGRLDWHFKASDVRDFAFAASPNFRWDAAGWNGVLIQTFYRSEATKWEEAIRMAVHSIKTFSEMWHPYPYPHATTVEGPIEGMEYPMLTFVPDNARVEDLHWVLAHEFGHEWFPMLVGSNERLYPWMDEGFNTFMDLYVAADYYKGTEYGESIEWNPLAIYPDNAVPGEEQALITRPVAQYNLAWTAYNKPALMLQLLRHEVLGPERFDAAFKAYIQAWTNKHPTPADFFRIMRDVSGMDLDWFWRGWVMTPARLDQAVLGVVPRAEGGSNVRLQNKQDMVMPLELRVDFADGTTQTFRLPVEMWNQGPIFTYRVPGTTAVRTVEIDPRRRMPDDERTNNVWRAP